VKRKGHRRVEGLIWGVPLGARPDCIPVSRPRGAKALGVKYEKALAGALPGWKHGQWFQFKDINGYGYCQVDLMIELEACVIVLEAKHTWVASGHRQITELYKPVLEKVYKKPVIGILVCKNLTGQTPQGGIVGGLGEALSRVEKIGPVVWQWLGRGAVSWPVPLPQGLSPI
jgi:hypothetical protein